MNTSTSIKSKAHQTTKQFTSVMNDRHARLAKQYRDAPETAWITDMATTGQGNTVIADPLHADVKVAGLVIPLGVHPAVGGDNDAPVPGELLCAALAGCMDSTIRIIANRLSIELTHLQVTVSAEIDVRGTLKFEPSIAVGFQKIHLSIEIDTQKDTQPGLVNTLLKAAEASCVVMQTLKYPPTITTQLSNVSS